MRTIQLLTWLGVAVAFFPTARVGANEFSTDWFTIDAGGAMWTAGGALELSGTIGQPEATTLVMTGGTFELVGGFWGVSRPTPGDLNCDGVVSPFDIDPFVLALVDPAGFAAVFPNCNILNADINGDGLINPFDIDPFVECIVNGSCQ